ncbi:MAG TPA: hypothetical protein PLL08_03060 [Bacteroidales bacterium]|nr:hypothetical protein [Bacteroidales bacterium]
MAYFIIALKSRVLNFQFALLNIFSFLKSFVRASWLREGAGGKPARAAAAGDAAAKKRL